jgi:DNA-binding transcriptional ArsR family regulator
MPQLPLAFRARANLRRLRIGDSLSYQGACASDLQAVLGLSRPFISRHLEWLCTLGPVRSQHKPARVYYYMGFEKPLAGALH